MGRRVTHVGDKQKGRAQGVPGARPFIFLYNTRFLESCVSAVFIDGLNSASRDGESDRLLELRNVDLLVLKIHVAT